MRFLMVFLVAVVLFSADSAKAIDPQFSGLPEFVQGGEEGVVAFGPYDSRNLIPSSYTLWSSDGEYFRVRRFFVGYGVGRDFEANAWKVPSSFIEAAITPVDTLGAFYTYFKINADGVASTDSVGVMPHFGR